MLPLIHKIAFFLFALVLGGIGTYGFYRLYLRVRRGAPASEPRWNEWPRRLTQALTSSLTQERTFRRRTWVSVLHAFIFYGFTFYLLVNVVDGLEGYFHFVISSSNPLGAVYNFLADLLSLLVLIGVVSLVVRRLYMPSKRDFRFTEKTLLHPLLKENYILRDSLVVSSFITFHVGSRLVGNAAKMVEEARLHGGQFDWVQPFSSALGSAAFAGLTDQAIHNWRIFGYWGALGSIIAFLAYFPYTKHIHIFMAPLNYALKRPIHSGVLPPMKGLQEAMESDEPRLGVEKLEELEWPRLLDAYACIQCNRCQDVCPANATGKALSPAALEINKRMELNVIAAQHSPFVLKPAPFEAGASTARPLLEYAINEESVWACTTCGACMQVCPVQDEQMLDIIDIRRNLVMVQGEFPPQLQTAFRGMERASNPWGLSRDKRLEWAEGLKVPTIEENPEPDVIYWVGCAASYDPGAQKVARSFVQLLDKAGVNYAVLGKKEACTGDSARRAGNEFLYQQLAEENVETLNTVSPKLIVATCPHCMNVIGNEYKQLGGDYRTIHHTEYLETLVAAGRLPLTELQENVVYHDPCYLGRHNGVFDPPRQLLTKMADEVLSLERERENSFCCGAGGAQFWKEEEEGRERVSDNRFRELQARLDSAAEASAEFERSGKVVAVGCPFCKAMLNSTPEKQKRDDIVVKDVAEIMLESMQRATGEWTEQTGPLPEASPLEQPEVVSAPNAQLPMERSGQAPASGAPKEVVGETSADVANEQPGSPESRPGTQPEAQAAQPEQATPARKTWKPGGGATAIGTGEAPQAAVDSAAAQAVAESGKAEQASTSGRKAWKPKATGADDVSAGPVAQDTPPHAADTQAPARDSAPAEASPTGRKAWKPKGGDDVSAAPVAEAAPAPSATAAPSAQVEAAPTPAGEGATGRKAWKPKAKADDVNPAPVAAATASPATLQAEAPAPAPSAAQATEPETSATGRKAWKPKASAASASSPQSPRDEVSPAPVAAPAVEAEAEAPAPAQAQTEIQDPLPQPPAPSAATSSPAEVGPSGRKLWQPKGASTPASAAPTPPAASAPAEHLSLPEVGVNDLEEGAQATSAPTAPVSSAPLPEAPQAALSPEESPAAPSPEASSETGASGRPKWNPKKKA